MYAAKACRGVQVQVHTFLTSVLGKVDSYFQASDALNPETDPVFPTGQEPGWNPEPGSALWKRAETFIFTRNRNALLFRDVLFVSYLFYQ